MSRIKCQQCDWVGSYADLISEWSGMEPHCPNNCWSIDFIEEDKKMNFLELEVLADSVAKKIGEAVHIGVSHWHHRSGSRERKYSFYRDTARNTIEFDSPQCLKVHMENILNPVEDEGIEINDLAEEGTLRGAE